MNDWASRPQEERALLNPGFCSILLWHAANGHVAVSRSGLPFDVSFLVLPIVLHRLTREALPRGTTTSLAVWLDEQSLARAQIADRARALVGFTKEALLFGGRHGLLTMSGSLVVGSQAWRKRIEAELARSSDEVGSCAKRAEFLGKWFASCGSGSTVMALMGVRP